MASFVITNRAYTRGDRRRNCRRDRRRNR